ncbi:MAG: hypothetical protein WCK21_07045, partial [Actinomycetota bacterium]
MVRSQLNSYSGNDPIWGFVALVGAERFTGEAAVGLDPRVHLFAADGRVYYAEREGEPPVGTRLVSCGAITAAQLEAGSVRLGGTASMARLFQRQPLIDRDAVELTIEHATEALLESVANKPVGMPEVFPLRHHPAGLHHWLRSAATLAPTVEPTPEPMAQPLLVSPPPAAPTAPAMPEPLLPVATSFVPLNLAPLAASPTVAVPETASDTDADRDVGVAPEPEPAPLTEPPTLTEPGALVEPRALLELDPTPLLESEPQPHPEPEFVVQPEPEPLVPAESVEPLF